MLDTAGLSLIAGAALSLLFTFVPGLSDWYATLEPKVKAQAMAFVLLIVSIGIVLVSCFGLVVTVPCTQEGIVNFALNTVIAAILALTANQAMYSLTKAAKKEAPKE